MSRIQIHYLIWMLLHLAVWLPWAHDSTIAVLMLDPAETSWSQSQIFVYDLSSVTLTTPLFTFPNNQQILGTRLLNPVFARFGITATGNMAILTSDANILIVPVAPAGYASRWIDTTNLTFVFYFQPNTLHWWNVQE